MTTRTRSSHRIVSGALALTFAACGEGEGGPGSVVRVDTLANGAIHVVSPAEGLWGLSGAEPWRVEEDLRIGTLEGEDPYVFGSVWDLIPDPLERIWVMDSQAHELRLFDAEGRHVRTVGGPGEGPGEFSGRTCAFSGPNAEIWVESNRRWQRYDTAGTLVGGQPVDVTACGPRRWLPAGRLVVETDRFGPGIWDMTSYLVEYAPVPAGTVTPRDTVPVPELPDRRLNWYNAGRTGRRSVPEPFAHHAEWALGYDADIWLTEGGGVYRIRRQGLAGDTLLVLERAYEPITIPDTLRAQSLEWLAGFESPGMTLDEDYGPGEMPRTFPPFDRLIPSADGTLWVRRQLGADTWGLDVFDPDGRFLGAVTVPPDFGRMRIHHVTPDRMYGVVRDELGVQYVVRLVIRKPDG